MSNPTIAKPKQRHLDPAALTLSGRHLIEASAGTGKTYNITRLYIRLLVERQLPVESILVMTFTKAATEELRGRIDRELRHAASHWGTLGADPFFAAMEARFDRARAVPLLQSALLHLDEAAIFTIHGFCARVLRQHALSSDLPMELEMEADTSEQALEAVRDWLRRIAHSERFELLSERGWHTPQAFMRCFGRALSSRAPLLAAAPENFTRAGLAQKAAVREELLAHEAEIVSRLIDSHKEAEKRRGEWEILLEWLAGEALEAPPKAAMDFVNGNRYRKDEALKAWLQPFKDLKSRLPELARDAEAARIYPVIREGLEAIRAAFAASKERLGLMDFDDLITLLAERVTAKEGAALVAALRQQYPVALVDEFQDTDPSQYAILERVYPHREEALAEPESGTALFMIGDPKQAIYSFRGGDIFTYLQARGGADDCWHMDTNWRSVPAMVNAYNRLFWGAPLDQDPEPVFGYGIDYEPVKAAKASRAHDALMESPPGDSLRALNFVWLTGDEEEEGKEKVTADFRHQVARWCCGEIHRLLSEPVRLGSGDRQARALEERDVAILVRTGTEAAIMQEALLEAGYPSVYLSARDNIFHSPEALELSQVLQGILACEEPRQLHRAFATALLGGDAARLARLASDADALVEARYQLSALRERWRREGFIPMMMALIHGHLQPPPARHERCLTNHLHLAELLQQASGNLRHPQQLLEWLNDQIQGSGGDSQAELRLESDANLIRIVTQHGSKGLEYPVVFVPFANYRKDPLSQGNQKAEYLAFHDPESGEARQQLGRTPEAETLARDEALAEAVRLLYVAVTRAEQRCYLCCAPYGKTLESPLARTLGFGARREGEPDWPAELAALAASEPENCALLKVNVERLAAAQRSAAGATDGHAQAAKFTGHIDGNWRLSSFSALTRNLDHARRDRKDHDDDRTAAAEPATGELALRFRLAKGAHAGNLLHDALEHTDFTQPRWKEALREPLLRFGGLAQADVAHLEQWLQECLEAPLPAVGGGETLRLCDLSWPHTLRESEFYFSMPGSRVAALARILREHRGEGATLELPGQQPLRGMMHGFIDLVFEHGGRFYVADYKSTHLGNRFEDYGYAALKRNNEANFYDLQYLIYSLALHRYLKGRVPDYQPGRHFGGVYYLYLRGMAAGRTSGIYHTAIDETLLDALDALFQGAAGASRGGMK
ncbi:exodeoxyribonuclease V subunit beta [Motiliproteus sp. SC1-56]|uniref:exodeoxyribonuclease V subunit beta n=1 Tax=Motiliproteus sp. SC1-56 TaxID=2799565 RepID=UPI001A8F3AE5|nr:exodeoxyribonuclease V subunit beta [Motiliproteus sp. SC1-56]